MLAYTLKINNVDFTDYVKYDSYNTRKTPVYSEAVMTMDGVTHLKQIRTTGGLTFELNPQNASTTQTLVAALLTQPCSVYYYSLQTQAYEQVTMKLDSQTAEFLAKCKFLGEKWNQIGQINLEEL